MHTLGEVIEHNSSCHGHQEAIICGERRLDWSTYTRRAHQLGSALYQQGLRSQDRAAILAMNCLEYYELYAACSLAGFITATVNFRL
ncbi:MAG: AMP-binding protein, partial [Oceanisphaera sp.]|nr:AMP-binding protein [Oceanisphaera sp.]